MEAYRRARQEALRRFGSVCIYCGARPKRITVDHVQPRSLGGADCVDNLVPCCRPCNELRAAWSIEVFFEMLLLDRGPYALLGIIDRITNAKRDRMNRRRRVAA